MVAKLNYSGKQFGNPSGNNTSAKQFGSANPNQFHDKTNGHILVDEAASKGPCQISLKTNHTATSC